MNKSEFVDVVQEIGDFDSKTQAQKAVNAVIKSLESILLEKKSVTFIGFGTFDTRLQKSRSSVIKKGGTKYITSDSIVPRFDSDKVLKEKFKKKCNKKEEQY